MHEKKDVTNTADEQEISLLDVLNFLNKYKKTILGVALVAGLLAVVVVMRMPDIYTASLKIIPPAQVQMVQSVLESERFKSNLAQQYHSNGDRNETRGQLAMVARIKAGKDGVIEVEVDDIDPKRAAALANAYPGELDGFIEAIGLSDTAKQKKKIGLRIQMLQKRLNDANKKLSMTGKKLSVGALVNEKQKAANIATLRAQLDVMMEGEASVNRAMPSLDKLRDQLERLFLAGSNRVNGHLSDNDQDYLDQFGEVQYLEVSIESLKNRQLLLELDEQLNNTRVLDLATVPERKSKPRRSQIVGFTMLTAAFLTILFALLKEWIAVIRKQKNQAANAP